MTWTPTQYQEDQKTADAHREASLAIIPTKWPPRKGALIHYSSGWEHTSWGGHVRQIIEDHLVVEVISGESDRGWKIIHENEWEHIRPGPLTLEGLAPSLMTRQRQSPPR
jgi:hypothetical protein